MLKNGLYEQIINKLLKNEIDSSEGLKNITARNIDKAEATKIVTSYLSSIIEKGLNTIDTQESTNTLIAFANDIVSLIKNKTKNCDFDSMYIEENNNSAQQLLSCYDKRDNISTINNQITIPRPETSLSQSSLFTNAVHEPQLASEFKKEIPSCDSIDILVSFIKWSGLRAIIDELREFTDNGGNLRVITTSYMGATDPKAIKELSKFKNTQIKISYDTKRTRLHAKTYVFVRNTGFTTAYIGSSNLSNVAMTSGLEWNIKITKTDMPETLKKITATFDSYWNSYEFEPYGEKDFTRFSEAISREKNISNNKDETNFQFNIRPYPYQQKILDRLDAERKIRNCYKNLIVAATGTGKTVISAFDYKRFCEENTLRPCRLLFVAHRKEILKQSLDCFRGILKDNNFGDLFVDGITPKSLDQLFISIQTFNSQKMAEKTSSEYYDFIIVDEFHHSAAQSYQELLSYYRPKILLGLTATPERMDGKDILEFFDNKIASEIRLPEAIERKLLSPFQYFGITDTVSLSEIKWSAGGYDKAELSNLYTINNEASKKRASMIIQSLLKYVTNIDEVKGLGFCVSVEHAKFMSNYFNSHNIKSIFLTGKSEKTERNIAKDRLTKGEIRFIFVVDIYNEGVDIPEINTILFLRPTESLTIFLQQLGRGLRLSDGKECLTVLDFIGQAHKKYNFEEKFLALLSNTKKSLKREIENGFINVPNGCYIQLEKVAKEYIFENIKKSFSTRTGLISKIQSYYDDTNAIPTLTEFIKHYHISPIVIYTTSTFSRLLVESGLRNTLDEENELVIGKALSRITFINSRRWIKFILDVIANTKRYTDETMTNEQIIMLKMFHYTIWQKSAELCGFKNYQQTIYELKKSPTLLAEIIELLNYNYSKIDFIDKKLSLGFDCPLDLHCSYTRDQILVAFGKSDPSSLREGVKYFPEKKTDIFLITLNKSEKDYSPTTMYNDYSINDKLFNWQSQNSTAANSPTGERYINHKKLNNNILLFVRENKTDSITGKVTAPYTYLGTATYKFHTGDKPMTIVWELTDPIPAKFLSETNKLIPA